MDLKCWRWWTSEFTHAFFESPSCDSGGRYLRGIIATKNAVAKLSDRPAPSPHQRRLAVTFVYRFGTTALMSAAGAGNAEGIKWLLQAGADAAATDTRGRTATDYVVSPSAKVLPPPHQPPATASACVLISRPFTSRPNWRRFCRCLHAFPPRRHLLIAATTSFDFLIKNSI
jgi:hypothetical protein